MAPVGAEGDEDLDPSPDGEVRRTMARCTYEGVHYHHPPKLDSGFPDGHIPAVVGSLGNEIGGLSSCADGWSHPVRGSGEDHCSHISLDTSCPDFTCWDTVDGGPWGRGMTTLAALGSCIWSYRSIPDCYGGSDHIRSHGNAHGHEVEPQALLKPVADPLFITAHNIKAKGCASLGTWVGFA